MLVILTAILFVNCRTAALVAEYTSKFSLGVRASIDDTLRMTPPDPPLSTAIVVKALKVLDITAY